MVARALLAAALTVSSASVLHDHVQSGDTKALEASLVAGQDINAIGPGGQTPLMQAVLSGNDAAVDLLPARGADASIGEQDGYTPCHGAGFQGRAGIMKALLAHGLPCTTDRHSDGFTPLHRACWGRETRHTETVRVLLEAGAPPDQPCRNGALPQAITSNHATYKVLTDEMDKKGLTKWTEVDAATDEKEL